jgi:hypothetical protein
MSIVCVSPEIGRDPRGLPYFLLTGCVTLPAVEIVKQTVWNRRARMMHDARIENEQTMRDYQDRYGR